MKKPVSLKDIAERVGVSTATVSYVLNNQKLDRISKEVAEKIRVTAARLNYRPNQLAKGLKTRRTNTIGLIVADIANSFSSALARIIENEAEANNYTVIFGSSDEKPQASQRLINVLMDRQVDGMIIAPAENTQQQIETLRKSKVPLVLIDRYFPELNVNSVAVKNYEAAREATSHLIGCGYRQIGMLGFKTSLLHLRDRKKGFTDALKKNGLSFSSRYVRELPLDATREEVSAALASLLALRPKMDALFFASNKLSTFGLQYLNTLSLRVPEDLALVSFDQSDATELFYSTVTHVEQPLAEMGKNAVRLLLDAINGSKKVTKLHLDARLVCRQSTCKRESES